MNVWHSAGGFDASVAGPMTWLINIVRNKAIDALRSGKTERASTLALDEEAMAVAADATQQPQALLERSLEKLRIAECMGGLGAPQRQALALAYYRGMVHTEIAETLGAPLGTVKAWVRRGLDKLKACLEAGRRAPGFAYMNYLLPERFDRLAREYALGTLAGPARRRFERLLRQAPAAMRAVGAWQERLGGLAGAVPSMQPSESVWRGLEERLFASARAAPRGPLQWLWGVLSVRALGGVLAARFCASRCCAFNRG